MMKRRSFIHKMSKGIAGLVYPITALKISSRSGIKIHSISKVWHSG